MAGFTRLLPAQPAKIPRHAARAVRLGQRVSFAWQLERLEKTALWWGARFVHIQHNLIRVSAQLYGRSMYQVINSVQAPVHQTTLNVASTLGVSPGSDGTIGPDSDALNTAISLGVVFLGSLTAGEIPGGSNSPSQKAAKSFVQSLLKTSGLAKAMWPNGSGNLDSLSSGLEMVMTNASSFVEFGNNGTYSGAQDVGPTLQSGSLDGFADAANTYSTSELLQTNGFYAVPGKLISRPTTGCTGFDSTGNSTEAFAGLLCTATDGSRTVSYWSPITGRSYTIVSKNGAGIGPAGVLKSIATQNQANLPVLFDGAYKCTLEGNAGPKVAFDGNGLPDFNCLSVLPMYLQCGTNCPQGATQSNGKCPFGYERNC
ncbi:MAG: hypothetical protein Q9191_004587 [Dirinaria sp. TL-2023a]